MVTLDAATSRPAETGLEQLLPTLFRLLLVIGLLVTLTWGTMEAMVTFLKPQPREITQDIGLPPKR